jgi:NADH-quinone oxidoreductase E subunit
MIEEIDFEFSQDSLKQINAIIAKYPDNRQKSAVMALLDLAQRQISKDFESKGINQGGHICKSVVDAISKSLSMPKTQVYEVASFYTMYNLKPVGKYLLQVCCTTPCMLRGSEDIISTISNHLGINLGETTENGFFTLTEVECLGACSNAPLVQINDWFYEDLDNSSIVNILNDLKQGKPLQKCSVKGRRSAEPLN